MKAHFVEFMSPGTFISEITTKPVAAWDVDAAKAMATEIVERHGARPYGFRFITRERGDADLDSKVTATSGTYFLGGVIRTIEEVEADDRADERIMLANMRNNNWLRIVTNSNSWRHTAVLQDGDVVLDFVMPERAAS